jgi:hypothetical protein
MLYARTTGAITHEIKGSAASSAEFARGATIFVFDDCA